MKQADKIKIDRWMLWKDGKFLVLNFTGEDINEEEIAICIDKQIYGDFDGIVHAQEYGGEK